MDTFSLLKVAHILGATVLFGTGLGTAFFMLRSRTTSDPRVKYELARTTVLADALFTAPAIILQPVTGALLIVWVEYDAFDLWLVVTYALYALAGLCWLPVVWIQIELRNILRVAIETGSDLPDRYQKLFKLWFVLGWPAFFSLNVIFYLMVAKPSW